MVVEEDDNRADESMVAEDVSMIAEDGSREEDENASGVLGGFFGGWCVVSLFGLYFYCWLHCVIATDGVRSSHTPRVKNRKFSTGPTRGGPSPP